MDSAALAYWLKPDLALTVNYGQLPAEGEARAAAAVAQVLGIEHEIIQTATGGLGLGSMSGAAQRLGVEPEWWPLRNQLLLTLAAMRLEREGRGDVIIGTVKSDSVHSDGTPQFVAAFNQLLQSQGSDVRVEAPAITMSSAELIRRSEIPLEVLGWTISCHVDNVGCGECRGCLKNLETRAQLEI